MKIDELKKLAGAGQLVIFKKLYREYVRRRYIWNKDYTKITEVKKIPYKVYYYGARTLDMPDHKSYKITKSDYEWFLQRDVPVSE